MSYGCIGAASTTLRDARQRKRSAAMPWARIQLHRCLPLRYLAFTSAGPANTDRRLAGRGEG
jgi:hypothetical protein